MQLTKEEISRCLNKIERAQREGQETERLVDDFKAQLEKAGLIGKTFTINMYCGDSRCGGCTPERKITGFGRDPKTGKIGFFVDYGEYNFFPLDRISSIVDIS